MIFQKKTTPIPPPPQGGQRLAASGQQQAAAPVETETETVLDVYSRPRHTPDTLPSQSKSSHNTYHGLSCARYCF